MSQRFKRSVFLWIGLTILFTALYIYYFGIEYSPNYRYLGSGLLAAILFTVACQVFGHRAFKNVIPWGSKKSSVQFIGSFFTIALSILIDLIIHIFPIVLTMTIPSLVVALLYYIREPRKDINNSKK